MNAWQAAVDAAARLSEMQPPGAPGVYVLLLLAAIALTCAPQEE